MRPKDEKGVSLAIPHVRLPKAALDALRQAGFLALAGDGRSVIWTTARKVAVLDKIIDHVEDGDSIPKWVFARDADRPDNSCLIDLWRIAEAAVRATWKVCPARADEMDRAAAIALEAAA